SRPARASFTRRWIAVSRVKDSAAPGAEPAGVDVHEVRTLVVAHAAALCLDGEIAQRRRGITAQPDVEGPALHVQRLLRDAVAGGGELRVALGRTVSGNDVEARVATRGPRQHVKLVVQ